MMIEYLALIDGLGKLMTGVGHLNNAHALGKWVCAIRRGDPVENMLEEILTGQQAQQQLLVEMHQLAKGVFYAANMQALHVEGGSPDLPTAPYLAAEQLKAALGSGIGDDGLSLISAPVWVPDQALPAARGATELSLWRQWHCGGAGPDEVEIHYRQPDGRVMVALRSRQALATAGVTPLSRWRRQAAPRPGGLTAAALADAAGIEPLAVAKPALPETGRQPATAVKTPAPERGAVVPLRAEPRDLDVAAVKAMLRERGFFDKQWNPNGRFDNDLLDNGDGTVTDRATGLMWQQGGSDRTMSYDNILAYIKEVNDAGLAGHHDWRLPTLEEAASLLEPEQRNGELYIAPVFDGQQLWIWTSDSKGSGVAWNVDFYNGLVYWDPHDNDSSVVRLCRGRGL